MQAARENAGRGFLGRMRRLGESRAGQVEKRLRAGSEWIWTSARLLGLPRLGGEVNWSFDVG
jgi:hypothetical protein